MNKIKFGIVGAGGQVGPKLLAYLADDPRIHVIGVCRNEISAGPLRAEGYDIRCGSVTDPVTAADLLQDCDVIINCSATSGTPAKQRVEERSMLSALCGLPGTKRLIHFSSVAVYGTCVDARRNRFERPRPDAPYGRHKLDLERYLWRRLRRSAHAAIVLRLGHVYGAGQWLSRFVLGAARDPAFRLPFDGRLPSNAVHVRNVSAAIRRLILEWGEPGTYNLFDAPATTWREVFDWNTTAVGGSPVPAMGDEESKRIAAYHRRRAATPLGIRLAVEIASWARSLPGSFVSACPAVKTLALVSLATLRQERLERYVINRYKAMAARAGGRVAAIPTLDSWLFSEGAPGPQLPYRGEIDVDDESAVAAWHRRYAEPDSILDWDSSPRGPGQSRGLDGGSTALARQRGEGLLN